MAHLSDLITQALGDPLLVMASNLLPGWLLRVGDIGDFVFFRLILEHLRDAIQTFGLNVMVRMMRWLGAAALTLMTLWVLLQGYRIVTGRSRDSMMLLVMNMARAGLVVSVATSMAMFGQELRLLFTQDMAQEITRVITGSGTSAHDQIDRNLGYMQLALSSLDALDVAGSAALEGERVRAMWFVGLGTGGPAVTAGAMLLLYEVALALFVGLGPFFIMCLLFEQTRSLFQRWLLYGVGTLFSMAVLAAMTSIAMNMVSNVAKAFWGAGVLAELADQQLSSGMTSMAMQQGGMGLILTTLILTAPPMAAMFFQGTVGSFVAYSQIGGSAQPGPQGQPPGAAHAR